MFSIIVEGRLLGAGEDRGPMAGRMAAADLWRGAAFVGAVRPGPMRPAAISGKARQASAGAIDRPRRP